jgi:hypothetical protein
VSTGVDDTGTGSVNGAATPQAHCPACADAQEEDVLGPELFMAMRIWSLFRMHPRWRQAAELYAGRDIEEVLSPEEAERFFDWAMTIKLAIVTIIGLLVANG